MLNLVCWLQVGEGSCKASQEGLGRSQEEICISRGTYYPASQHVPASAFPLPATVLQATNDLYLQTSLHDVAHLASHVIPLGADSCSP